MKTLLRLVVATLMGVTAPAYSEDLFPNKKPIQFEFGRALAANDTIAGYPIWQGDGKWRLIHLEVSNAAVTERRLGTTMREFAFGRAYLIQVERGKLASSMEVRANLEVTDAEYWTGEPCKPDDLLWKKSFSSNAIDVSCVTLSHLVNFPLYPLFKPYLTKLRQDNVDLPPTVLSISISRSSSNGRRLLVQLNINPELYGFPREPERVWTANPWHKDFALKDPKKKEFIDHLAKWAEAFAIRMGGAAFRKDPQAFDGLSNYYVGLEVEPLVAAGSTAKGIPVLPRPIMAPAWQAGDEWEYAYKSPSGSGTFVWAVNRIETFDEVPHYVVTTGARELFYRVSDLAISLERVKGSVVTRYTPNRTSYSWPLNVGNTWEQSYRVEFPVDRQTSDRIGMWEVESEEPVTVPAGTFRTLKITLRNKNTGALISERWYAPEVKQWIKEREFLAAGIRDRELIAFKFK